MEFPLRHVSIRVPWHDSEWNGTICKAPQFNGACTRLKGIAGKKNEAQEVADAGQSLENLPFDKWPCCASERSTFMAPFDVNQRISHALAKSNPKNYGHFQETQLRLPAFSAGIVPFRWLMRENMEHYAELYGLDVDKNREPDLGYESSWVHEAGNQTALLDGFAHHLKSDESLCFFYAKHVPFVEGTGRILMGVGRVKNLSGLTEYNRSDSTGMRGMVWERPLQHSIRPKGSDGFLLPYLEILKRAEQDPSLDIERYTAKAPDEHWDEFSYASELVTHDGAIGALLSLDAILQRVENELGIITTAQRGWVHTELIRLWKVRGPFPGLGAVLGAFGLSRGIFIAHALQQKAGENCDPWPLLDQAFANPASLLPKTLHADIKELAPTWKDLPAERRASLSLLSRFEITLDQARSLYEKGSRSKIGWDATDKEILQNPYRIFEISRHDPEGVKLLAIDRGVFPEDSVRLQHPLPAPSALNSALDLRRVRAFCISALETAAAEQGHTLLPCDQLVSKIADFSVRPACPVTGDMLAARVKDMAPEIVEAQSTDDLALQLERYQAIRKLVTRNVNGRIAGARHTVTRDWKSLLDKKFLATTDPEEIQARTEKAAALKELAEARCSVLVGPAGAGKTSVLGILCAQPEIAEKGLLLLAPTGKARVRMQELMGGSGATAFTIAQFLNQHGRYDGKTGRYLMNDKPPASGFGTVIVDESSMLTEDMLGSLFNVLPDAQRFIFVGDPAQLPPIGAGRPFVDIIARVRPANYGSGFPRVYPGYAELTIERRQVGKDRPDLRLARWFSTTAPSAADDDVFFGPENHPNLRFVAWEKPADFQQKLVEVLVEELKLSSPTDFRGFNRALGATVAGEYDYFNATRNGKTGAVSAVEAWQLLSPLRGMPFGVGDINRQIHQGFRAPFLDLASRQGWQRPIPKPMGAERIVYGDKVINLSNHRRDGRRVYPQEGALGYLANGEIGVAVGLWKAGSKILKVEFSSQQGFTYDFYGSDFKEEGAAALELAYALTVHKAQGSQFGLVILVLPEGHPILCRELIYTALTRHQQRVVIMHQGPRALLKDFAAPHQSQTARRMTNLLHPCRMVEVPLAKGSLFLQEGLIHRTSKGLPVRSKSEFIIAEALTNAGIRFSYETALTLGGKTRYPDFTINDEISGRTIYWEHLGMLERADYRKKWEEKLAWYKSHGICEATATPAGNAMLVTTTESSTAGFDGTAVKKIIEDYLGG